MLKGEYFTNSDIQSRAKVGVLGERAAENLFGNYKDAVGKTVRLDNQRFKIIGVYENTGAQEIDNNIMIPYKTTFGSMNPKKKFRGIMLGVAEEDAVELVKTKAEEALLRRYDEDDFIGLEEKKRNTIFTICYNGTFSRVVPIEPLISAIIKIHQRHNIPICLSIATPTKKEKLLSRYSYLFQNNLIDYKGFLPHRESLKNVYQSDISALILNDSKATEGMLPAKTFEYLRVGNPILLLHRKESFLAKIIEKTKTGITVNIKNQDEIIHSLLMLYEKWRQNEQTHHPDWNEIKKNERKHLTKQLADIFNKFT